MRTLNDVTAFIALAVQRGRKEPASEDVGATAIAGAEIALIL
jgi:hypothetical protein